MNDVGVSGITSGVRYGGNGTEVYGVANLVAANVTPIAVFLDFLIQSGLIALGYGRHVANHLHDVIGIEAALFRNGTVLILHQIIAGGQARNGILAVLLCAAGSRIRQIGRNLLRKSLRVFFGLQGFGDFLGGFAVEYLRQSLAVNSLCLINAISPNNVGKDFIAIYHVQTARENLIGLVGRTWAVLLLMVMVYVSSARAGAAIVSSRTNASSRVTSFFMVDSSHFSMFSESRDYTRMCRGAKVRRAKGGFNFSASFRACVLMRIRTKG